VHIQSVTIAGFRSFGPVPVKIDLVDTLTAVVGPNASGKTALLQTLCKMFGVTRTQRTIDRSDFHLPVDVAPDDRSTRTLSMEAIIALPELAAGSATPQTIAPTFKHMQIAGPGAQPVCRLRLEAQWEDDGTAEGEVKRLRYSKSARSLRHLRCSIARHVSLRRRECSAFRRIKRLELEAKAASTID
jgi:putative ATP-dependent endonuclease of OLD family